MLTITCNNDKNADFNQSYNKLWKRLIDKGMKKTR